jgi:DNA polymerase-3 subunit epsilon
MRLQLDRPLIIFDLETTGIQVVTDRVIDLFAIKVLPDGREEELNYLLNPGIPIPPESTAIHGISDQDVQACPLFKEVASEIFDFFSGCDIGGFNSTRFDFPLLIEEFTRVDMALDTTHIRFVDVMRIFHAMEPRNLTAAYQFYCNKSLDDAHSAEADTKATLEILKAQINRYESLGSDVNSLHELSGLRDSFDLAGRIRKNQGGEAVFGFGKHKGKRVIDVFEKEPNYYHWMMQSEFPSNTKQVITKLRLESINSK